MRNREKEKERRDWFRPAALPFLFFLQRHPMYEGTVPYKVKMARRAKNKVARRSRRENR